jgi:hypothetical protein
MLERSLSFQRAELEEDPESADLRQRLSTTFVHLDSPEDAAAVLRPIIPQSEPNEWDSGDVELYAAFGTVAALTGDRTEAERISYLLTRARWKNEWTPAFALGARSSIAAALGDCDAAARLLEEMVTYALEGWNNPHWRGVGHGNPAALTCRDHPSWADLLDKYER